MKHTVSLLEQARALAASETSAVALTEAYLAQISADNPRLNAVWHTARESALAAAHSSDMRRQQGQSLGALDGICIGVKDNIDVAGMPCSAGMATRRELHPNSDAHVITLLRAAGAIVLGKLSLHEGALGADNDNPHFGACHNPKRIGFTPGGSSGGSAAAVAANFCAAALGTDTMGSVRIPAAYCGVVGFKPSYGRVSQRGLVPACARLDHVGWLTRSAGDLALLYQTLSAPDHLDPYYTMHAQQANDRALLPMAELRIGVLGDLAAHGVQSGVMQVFEQALTGLRQAKLNLKPVDLSAWNFGADRRAGLLATEADMARFHAADLRARPELFSPTLLAMLRYAQGKSAPDLAGARMRIEAAGLRARQLFAQFEIDLLLLPTTPQTAFAFGQAAPANQADLTSIANFGGLPALSLPCGAVDGLPVGMQVIAPVGCDQMLMGFAVRLEALLG
jgi:Asp-tRNA(Asn)/Glu-tRNA(Gln) amidotransferase A subunit family amidase